MAQVIGVKCPKCGKVLGRDKNSSPRCLWTKDGAIIHYSCICGQVIPFQFPMSVIMEDTTKELKSGVRR